jgi:3-hydroxybutyryl-CoA dehydrogenase
MPFFSTAAVIGTGMMGPGIALTLAIGGVRTTILSRTEEGARRGLEIARAQANLLHENGIPQDGSALAAADRLASGTHFDETISGVDLVVESAPENMEFKQDLFARMDALAKPGAVLASNTSGLSISEIASKCSRPERVLTTHFWNPPHLMPLVEIVKGAKTADSNAEGVRDLLKRCGKVPVVVKKDRPGQLGNRLQMALVREAVNIVAEGIASAEDVDLAAKTGFGLRLPVYGILEHQDIVGLDLGSAVLDYVSRDLCNEPGLPRLVKDKLASGQLGVKTGSGYYDWSVRDANAVKALRDRFVLHFLKAQRNGFTS